MRCRNQHSMAFQIPSASKDAYKNSFFSQTIRHWHILPDSLISSAELSDDCVSKFTSLVTGELGTNIPRPVGLDSEKRIVSEKMRKERKKRGKEAKRWEKEANLMS